MMKNITLIMAICLHYLVLGQDYKQQFQDICKEGKLLDSEEFLTKWEKAEPNNPEMYIGQFNFYLIKSKSILGEPGFNGGYLIAADENGIDTEEIAKKMKEVESLFNLAQDYLSRGLKISPNRLDMHIGKLNTLIEKSFGEDFISALEAFINQQHKNEGKWLVPNHETMVKDESEFIGILQSYLYRILSNPNPDYNKIMRVSELALKTYPKNNILLTNLGLCKLESGEYEAALSYFKKGLESKPNDMIIRFNIADTYVQLKQLDKAKKQYDYIIANGQEDHVKMAQEFKDKL